ncbi:glycine--tRNA ligase subunit beta [uncultured Xylophilus sp.]|uniref:glycine--tRNA ligase subunit beta n=1 Tax=uncultured Xylophilus sp. TaxID=296832 RepID=UPI0025D61B4E|nr:glycine--tRNA ligase subunit beta [uncultured Xylophilus sp.]
MTTTHKNLLVELFVEELPPKALKKLGDAFAQVLFDQLTLSGLTTSKSTFRTFASPRRLAVQVSDVLSQAPDVQLEKKLMLMSAAFDKDGNATAALLKKAAAEGPRCEEALRTWPEVKDVPDQLFSKMEGNKEFLYFKSLAAGHDIRGGLQRGLSRAIAELPIPKVMGYQLADHCEMPGWTTVSFVRPAHGLVALHGSEVVPVEVLGLRAGNQTHGHRFEAKVDPVVLRDADGYAAQLQDEGAVIAGFAERRAEIVRQLQAAAAGVGGGVRPIEDDALLDEVTALVERPNVLVCRFEEEFLAVPQECLILTMKANQKYFPLLDADGRLTHRFLVVSNISPDDASAVIGGNERVVRPRLADAKFFFDQDRKKPLAARVEALGKVVYHNKLGSQGERVERVRAIARAIAGQIGGAELVAQADQAALLAKTDLVTDMVGEFPELQGTMGRYYAQNDGLPQPVADAIEDHYKPRFAGDELPRNDVGTVVALADKLETLVGMFGIGNLPTGDRDPFALRRHALGVIRMLSEKALPLDLDALVRAAVPAFGDKIQDPTAALLDFVYDRLAGGLREQGYSAQEVDAVLALRPQRLGDVAQRLAAVRAFAALPEAAALAAANKRVANILKKAGEVDAHVSEVLLQEPAEQALYAALQRTVPQADAQFAAGDYTASLQTLAALRAPVDAFFDGVMVNAEQADLRLNRQGLLKTLHAAMNRVADLSRLAA